VSAGLGDFIFAVTVSPNGRTNCSVNTDACVAVLKYTNCGPGILVWSPNWSVSSKSPPVPSRSFTPLPRYVAIWHITALLSPFVYCNVCTCDVRSLIAALQLRGTSPPNVVVVDVVDVELVELEELDVVLEDDAVVLVVLVVDAVDEVVEVVDTVDEVEAVDDVLLVVDAVEDVLDDVVDAVLLVVVEDALDVVDEVVVVDDVVVVLMLDFRSRLDTEPLMSLFAMSVSQTFVAKR